MLAQRTGGPTVGQRMCACGAVAVRAGRCRSCDEVHRLHRLGACVRCAEQGIVRAVWANKLCSAHQRSDHRERIVEATGYRGTPETRGQFNSLVESLIRKMEEVADVYIAYLDTGKGYDHPSVNLMHELLMVAKVGLDEKQYLYILNRINRKFGGGIPLPWRTNDQEAA